jgi:multidrug efflux pump subunit AcrA (membrane-fusion protein)
MKRLCWVASLILLVALTSCSGSLVGGSPTPLPTIALGGNSPSQTGSSGNVSASGLIVPIQHVELSFPLTGKVSTVGVKAGEKVTVAQPLVTLDTTILEARVREADANLSAAQTQVAYLKRIGTDQEHLQSAQADVDRAQAALDSAKATLAQATLKAPIEGTVASLNTSPAETVIPGQVVVTLGDLTRFQIETTDLSERDVPQVQVGQAATVFVPALNQQFAGQVSDIAREASTLGGDVVYQVTIQLDDQPSGLLWGMSADVEIQTGE